MAVEQPEQCFGQAVQFSVHKHQRRAIVVTYSTPGYFPPISEVKYSKQWKNKK